MASSTFKNIMKVSCVGCLGVLFLLVVTVVVIGWLGGRGAAFVDADASYPLEQLGALEPSVSTPSPQSTDPVVVPTNRIQLVVTGVEGVVVRPCDPGEGLTVDATYDETRVDFSEAFVESADGTWDYSLNMSSRGSQLTRIIARLFAKKKTKLEMCLPTDTRFALDAAFSQGGVEADLGGLWLSTIDFEISKSGGVVEFSTELREPAESLLFRTEMGGAVIGSLGNASPAQISLEASMGGLVADFSGAWRGDVGISIESSMSGVTLVVPEGLNLHGLPANLAPTGPDIETAPTLRFSADSNFKDVKLQRR